MPQRACFRPVFHKGNIIFCLAISIKALKIDVLIKNLIIKNGLKIGLGMTLKFSFWNKGPIKLHDFSMRIKKAFKKIQNRSAAVSL